MKLSNVRLLSLCRLWALAMVLLVVPQLHAQITLSGRVTDPSGQGTHPVDIDAWDSLTGTWIPLTGDSTNVNGYYSFSIWPGTYDVAYNPVPSTHLAPVILYSVPLYADTTINVTTPWGMQVTGIITDSFGAPVVNLDIDVIDTVTNELQQTPTDQTDGSGAYSIIIAEGTYDFIYTPDWRDSMTTYTLWDVPVHSDTTMNVQMPRSIDLSGFVRNEGGTGIPNVDLDVHDAATGRMIRTPADNTFSDGSFLIHVWPGVWNVDFEPPRNDPYADNVIYGLVVNHDLTLNITLKNGMTISGLVTNPLDQGVPNVDLDVDDVATGARLWTSHDNTDSNGNYTIKVPPGLYNIMFEDATDSVHLAPVEIDSVQITGNTVINQALPWGHLITGVIRDDNNSPVKGCMVQLLDSGTGRPVYTPSNLSHGDGSYQIRAASGTYDIAYLPTPESGVQGTVVPSVLIVSDQVRDVTLQRTFNQAVTLMPTLASIFAGDQLFEEIMLYNNDTQARRVQVRLDALLPGGGSVPILPPFPTNGVNLPGGAQAGGTLPIAVPSGAPPNLEVTLQGLILDYNLGDTLNVDSTDVRILDPNNPAP